MTQSEENERMRAGLKDMAEYMPYTGAKERAVEILDFDKPLKLSASKRLTGKVE